METRAVAQRNDPPTPSTAQDIAEPDAGMASHAPDGAAGALDDDDDSPLPMPALPAGAELRAAPRFTLLIRAAKLIADDGEYLCILRDASATGVKIRIFTPIPAHKHLSIELGNGDRHAVRLVWSANDHAGLQFLEQIDVQRLIEERGGSHPRRQVRLRLSLDAVLHSGGESVHVRFQDISQQGACIECDKWLLLNELVRIDTGVFPSIYAKVRWRNQPRYGLVFEQTFKLDELARISAPLQQPQAGQPAGKPRTIPL